MKQTPQELLIRERMQPGVITLSGFLGDDPRALNQIISDDEMTLQNLGVTAQEIAERMEYLTEKSKQVYEGRVIVDDMYEIETEITRGKLPCPFLHRGLQRKTITTCTHLSSGITVRWTALNIHMIKEHGFFEGKDSPFRLEPEILVQVLFPG